MSRVTDRLTDAEHGTRWDWLLAAGGAAGAAAALIVAPHDAAAAADQTWSPFVLVTGLVLIGLVAEDDGVFRALGAQLARVSGKGVVRFLGAALLIALVTATLNLDTSVVFVTPVLLATARQSGSGERPLLYGSILLANASSLFLPGSNLTNLIVLGRGPHSGRAFLSELWPAAVAALVVTAACLAFWGRRDLTRLTTTGVPSTRPTVGVGLVAVALATAMVLALGSPALPVLVVGVVACTVRLVQRQMGTREPIGALGAPVLIGLFGATVMAGTVGREWSGPSSLLAHAGSIATAVIAAAASVLINNLPAASLLAAHHSHHPSQLLIGLNLGPNLFVTGSLAWFLWFRVARSNGAAPSIAQASRLGIVIVPLSVVAALLALAAAGSG
jgi:arsenical pump membrane protein